MNLSELNMDNYSNRYLQGILEKGGLNIRNLTDEEFEIYNQLKDNQRRGIPNFRIDGPIGKAIG